MTTTLAALVAALIIVGLSIRRWGRSWVTDLAYVVIGVGICATALDAGQPRWMRVAEVLTGLVAIAMGVTGGALRRRRATRRA